MIFSEFEPYNEVGKNVSGFFLEIKISLILAIQILEIKEKIIGDG
jgi:hypothetical protein